MNVTTFDRATCKLLREAMNAALAGADIQGATFEVGNMSFVGTECNIKVRAVTAGNAEKKDDKLASYAKIHRVASLVNADGWALVDYHPKKRMYPFIFTKPGGKRFKCSPDQARHYFGEE